MDQSEIFFIVLLAIAVSVFTINFLLQAWNKKVKKIVLENSERIKKLKELNQEFSFHFFNSKLNYHKHYDNKSSFTKINPSDLMGYIIRERLDKVQVLCDQVRENISLKEEYIEKISEIPSSSITREECENLKIGYKTFLRKEEKIFEKEIISPPTEVTLTILMTYTSPKGKVNLDKEETFTFQEIFNCFNSVSRSRVNRSTYQRIAAVERGEVSDSLRYDIMQRDGFRCVICGAAASEGVHLHVDHIVPIAKGGKSTPDNLRTLCERCNIGKSAKIEQPQNEEIKLEQSQNNFSKEGKPEEDFREEDLLICPKCGQKLILRNGRNGFFYGCSSYPKCRYTKDYFVFKLEQKSRQYEQKREQPKRQNEKHQEIIDVVCEYYQVTKEDLLGHRRDKFIVLPRQVCMFLFTEMTSLSLVSIGEILERDHTSVIHARDKVAQLIKQNNKLAEEIKGMKALIES